MKKFLPLGILLILVTVSTYAQNGTRLIDYNAKTLGRAGTTIGFFDSPVLMLSNPAGISFLDGSALDANFSLMMPSLHFKNTINDLDGDNNVYPLPSLSFVSVPGGSSVSWGLGVFTTGGMGGDYTMNHALFRDQSGNYIPQEYHSMLAVIQGGPSISWRITPFLSVGASAHLVYSTMEFQMPYSLDPLIMKGTAAPGLTFGEMFSAPPTSGGFGYDEVTAAANMTGLSAISFTGRAGVAMDLGDGLSMGLSYGLPTSLKFKNGTADMDMSSQLGDAFGRAVQAYMAQNQGATPAQAQAAVNQQFAQLGIDMSIGVKATYDIETEFGLPQSIGAGLMYAVSDDFRLGLDVEWLNWESAFDQMDIRLSGGQNANINKMLGSSDLELVFPMNWVDAVLLKIGGEYDLSPDFVFRAGYAYGSNPVPAETVFPVFPAIVEHHLTAGVSYHIVATPITIHAAFEHALGHEQTAAIPSKVANEFDGSSSKLSNTLLHIGATWGL